MENIYWTIKAWIWVILKNVNPRLVLTLFLCYIDLYLFASQSSVMHNFIFVSKQISIQSDRELYNKICKHHFIIRIPGVWASNCLSVRFYGSIWNPQFDHRCIYFHTNSASFLVIIIRKLSNRFLNERTIY